MEPAFFPSAAAAPEEEEPVGPCWCGEENPAYLDDGLDASYGGSGVLRCRCGGDSCVCHHHGELECLGCDDCDGDPDGEDDEDLDDGVDWDRSPLWGA